MTITTLNRARRKLALGLVEYLDRWIVDHDGVLDVDEAAAEMSCLIPDTRAEAQAEYDTLDKALKQEERLQQPSIFGELRAALGLDSLSIAAVLKSATDAVRQRDRLRKTVERLLAITGYLRSDGQPIEPSSSERAEWSETSESYVAALEEGIDQLCALAAQAAREK